MKCNIAILCRATNVVAIVC